MGQNIDMGNSVSHLRLLMDFEIMHSVNCCPYVPTVVIGNEGSNNEYGNAPIYFSNLLRLLSSEQI
jgi:hypothetical protein